MILKLTRKRFLAQKFWAKDCEFLTVNAVLIFVPWSGFRDWIEINLLGIPLEFGV